MGSQVHALNICYVQVNESQEYLALICQNKAKIQNVKISNTFFF